MGMRFLWVALSVLTMGTKLLAQVESQSTLMELKKVPIAPSPNASAIGKFGEIPVSLSTGIPSIQVPMYQYQSNDKGISVDVSLRYHAGGHKVDDMAANVGLGWSLNAGGVVSRTMRGRPDDGTEGYLSTGNLPAYQTQIFDYAITEPSSSTSTNQGICYDNSSDYYTIKNIAEGELDGECDIFQFSVGSVTGKFYFKKNGQVQLVTQQNVKITFSAVYSYGVMSYIDEFVITDEWGNKYVFNQKEWASSSSALGSAPPVSPSYISSWYLKKIIAASDAREIIFNYTSPSYSLQYEGGFATSYRTKWEYGNIAGPTEATYGYSIISILYPQRISSIDFPNGNQVLFNYNLARLDYVGDYALTDVVIKNNSIQKKYVLEYDYFISPTCYPQSSPCTPPPYSANDYYRRLKLTAVKETGGSQIIPPYTFEYNATPLPVRNSAYKDAWGYYSGTASANSSGTPITILTPGQPFTLFFSDALPVEQYTKAWVLEKINYPTGGFTSLTYELNNGYNNGVFKNIGGLRIKKTEDNNGATSNIVVTNYSYVKADNSSSGTMQTMPNTTYYWTVMRNNYSSSKAYFLNQTNSPTQSLSYFNGSPVIYTRVKVDKNSNGQNNGHSISEYSALASYHIHQDNFPYVQKQDLDWAQGLLLKETHYNSSNALVKQLDNEYQDYTYYPSADPQSRNTISGLLFWDDQGSFNANLYGARSYYMNYGRSALKKRTETIYENGIAQTNITDYYYDHSNYYFPSRVKRTNSKGQEIEQRLKHPYDFTGTYVYDQMVARNILAPIIESKQVYLSGGLTQNGVLNNYGLMNGSIIDINNQQRFNTSANGWDTEVVFNQYDSKGNILQMSPKNGPVVAYIWGTNQTNVLAKIEGATYAEVLAALGQSDPNLTYLQQMGETDLRNQLSLLRNNLKSSKPKAQVTTFLYKPLAGIKEQTNPNGKTSYFEYDVFNRLSLVKDQDGNILKRICYNYQGQPEVCYTAESAGGQTVYARLSYENQWWSGNYSYADIVVRFYSDAAGTIPLSVSNLPTAYQNQSCYGTSYNSATANGTAIVLNYSALVYEYNYDYGYWWDCSYNYGLTSGNYIIIQ